MNLGRRDRRTFESRGVEALSRINLSEYSRIRKRLTTLQGKAVKSLTRSELGSAAKELGILSGADDFVFDSEDEMSLLMDFAVYEVERDGVPVIQCYLQDHPPRDGIPIMGRHLRRARLGDKTLHEAIRRAFTSLFRVDVIQGDTLKLVDLLHSGQPFFDVVDRGLLSTGVPGMLMFTRLLPLPEYHVTSGAALCFPGSAQRYLVRSYPKIAKGGTGHRLRAVRFRFFHKESKRRGLEVRYE